MFMTFEGIDGSGKTTQIERLKLALEQHSCNVLLTREPGATPVGQQIRQIVMHTTEPLDSTAELFLYEADRAHHVSSVIRPALAKGQWVISDRYADSTVAYQGYGRQLDLERLYQLNAIATQGLKPVKTFWLDGPVDVLLARAKGRQNLNAETQHDRFESEKLEFFERLRLGYQTMAEQEPERFVCLDATQTPELIAEQIWQHMLPLLAQNQNKVCS